jgi:molybdopterin-synthase adenylyltransferase
MELPRVKPEHAPYRLPGGRIRLGGLSYGIAAEVGDPTGSVWTLLRTMDGTRSPAEVVARVVERHPAEPAESVWAAVAAFVEAGYVEDAGGPVPEVLTGRDRERYDRSRRYFRWVDLVPRASTWEPQAALRRATVTVAGVGGTGGTAALALAASGVGRLRCVDSDTVELSNLNRQVLYTEADIGRPKVAAAVRRLRALNSDIEVSGERRRIGGVDDLAALAGGCDVLLLAADRPREIRDWANRACLATGTPWVTAGYTGPTVTVASYRPGDGACWECLRDADEERRRELGDVPLGARPDPPAANAVAAPAAGLSGYLAADAVLALITGVPPAAPGRMYGVNLVALDAPFTVAYPRRPGCPACGSVA